MSKKMHNIMDLGFQNRAQINQKIEQKSNTKKITILSQFYKASNLEN